MNNFENVDLGWQPEPLWDEWPKGRDTEFIMWRMEQAFVDIAKLGGSGPMLDAACGQARHVPELHRAGWQVFGLEPSPEMIVRARHETDAAGVPLELYRGIGEVLPFKDGTFDRVVCMSSLDHYADPAKGMREMARVLKPDGRVIIAVVNYHGLSCRASRLVYKLQRRFKVVPAGKRLLWDDPTMGEHTFEGSVPAMRTHAGTSLTLESTYGVSMLWALPGWSTVIGVFPGRIASTIIRGIDAVARKLPGASDFVVTTWRRS